MAHGFSGGFFLPAQRSMHCKGGFFSSATRVTAPPPTTSSSSSLSSSAAAAAATAATVSQFPVLFALPQARRNNVAMGTNAVGRDQEKPRRRRVYDPEEGEDEWIGEDRETQRTERESPPVAVHKSASATRFVRGRQHKPDANPPHATRSRDNNATFDAAPRPRHSTSQEQPQQPRGDINSKFEIAMNEFNQIKDEFDLKHQRQNSAPALPTTAARPIASSVTTERHEVTTKPPASSISKPSQPSQMAGNEQPPVEQPTHNLQSPRQRLQVAEIVMRKLYKKNLQTEQELASVKAEKEQLTKRLADREAAASDSIPLSVGPEPTRSTVTPPCARCAMNDTVGFALVNPPSMETISRIDQQQLDYLRHLAAEQDRTISSLKIRIEQLSTTLTTTKLQQQAAPNAGKSKTATPRQAVNKLQGKLKDALQESERQKSNYLKLKRDFQHLLALKTKTLYENPQQLNASARELVSLMEKQLKQLESEHSMNLSVYNSQLYEREQQSCESYAQQRILEEEMERVARDVEQRDAVDVQIEQCMASVFERLHHIESENIHLKKVILQN